MNYKLAKLMIIDDDVQSLRSMSTLLRTQGFTDLIMIEDPTSTMAEVAAHQPEIILLDLHMPDLSGESLLVTIKQEYPEIVVIIITGDDQIQMAVKCTRLGAYDYFVKPIDQDRLIHVLNKALEDKQLNEELFSIQRHLLSDSRPSHKAFEPILTNNANMKQLFKYIEAISMSMRSVLILGETGTGKELFAKAIHDVSGNKGKFVAVNIAGFDEVTLSDSLFGHRKGAFTGAQDSRKGLISKAQSGSLFLDEIGDLNPQSQIKILRLLQENNYYPLGSDSLETSTARIITATHQDLEALIAEGEFRRDLFFRLQVHTIKIPPLRERRDDIPLLVDHFLKKACEELKRPFVKVPLKIFELFDQCSFLGNIRELEMLIYDALIHTQGDVLELEHLSEHIETESLQKDMSDFESNNDHFTSLEELPTIKKLTENLIDEALKRTQNNQKKASTILGISRQALNKRLLRRSIT